jgi:hypothetical protein
VASATSLLTTLGTGRGGGPVLHDQRGSRSASGAFRPTGGLRVDDAPLRHLLARTSSVDLGDAETRRRSAPAVAFATDSPWRLGTGTGRGPSEGVSVTTAPSFSSVPADGCTRSTSPRRHIERVLRLRDANDEAVALELCRAHCSTEVVGERRDGRAVRQQVGPLPPTGRQATAASTRIRADEPAQPPAPAALGADRPRGGGRPSAVAARRDGGDRHDTVTASATSPGAGRAGGSSRRSTPGRVRISSADSGTQPARGPVSVALATNASTSAGRSGASVLRPRHPVGQVLVRDRHRPSPRVNGRRPVSQLERDDAERVQVAARSARLAADLLGSEVLDGCR